MEYSDHLEQALTEYKAKLEAAERDLNKLKIENNHFRLMLLTPALEPDAIYFANKRSEWSELPVDMLMAFLELHDKHAKIYSELIHTKLSKSSIKEHLDKRHADKIAAAKQYRETKNPTIEQRVERRVVTKTQSQEDKAIKAISKATGKSYDEARVLLQQTIEKYK